MRFASKLCLFAGLCTSTMRATPAFTITPLDSNDINFAVGYSFGYEVQVLQSVTVNKLGYFAESTLTETHQVGIYDASGTQLVTATVTNADPLSNYFRYATVSPLVLTPGSYEIMGTSGLHDVYTFNPVDMTNDPCIAFIDNRWAVGNVLQYGSEDQHRLTGFFGPNLDITDATAAPEPGTLALVGLLFLVIGVCKYRSAD